MKTISLAPLLLLSLVLPAAAEAYKCRQPDGRTEISSEPCASGSSTVKSVPDETVSEQSRERAEREAERMRKLSDKNDAARLATEKAEREERERAARQRQSYVPPPSQVDDCLRTVDRMALDSTRRAELIAGCQSTGAVQPVYVPVPYYTVPGYVRPPHRPHPEPMPSPPPNNPAKPGKPVDLYKVPGNSLGR